MNTKMVHYAYPSSPMSEEYGRARVGCWYVACERSPGILTQSGPFDSIASAEGFADGIDLPFDSSYIRFPLNGSKFTK